MKIQTMFSVLFLAASTVVPGCTCLARDQETYRADTRTLIETKAKELKDCYDAALVANPTMGGKVTLKFKVEKKTGKILDTQVDKDNSDAPEELGACLVRTVDGLVLAPVDKRDGLATFSWTFTANPQKEAEAEAAAEG